MAKTIFEEMGGKGITLSPALLYQLKRKTSLSAMGTAAQTLLARA